MDRGRESSRAASYISAVSSAPVIAFFTFLSLSLYDNRPNLLEVLTVSAVFSTIIPLGILVFFSRRQVIPDLWATSRESRWVPFVEAAASYFLGSIALFFVKAPPMVVSLMLCYLGNTLIMMMITLRWKISVHASGITGPTVVLVYSIGLAASVLSLLLIPVGWARIRLNSHTLPQFVAGALVTVITTWLQLRVYLALL